MTAASSTFHSRGISQSNTRVPLGTSCTMSGTRARISASVSRTPAPVMLLQIGYKRAANS